MTRHFRSKVDALVLVPSIVGLGLPVLLVLGGLVEGRPVAGAIIPMVLLAAVAPLMLVSYEVTSDQLIVRQGWWRRRMPLSRLRALKATRAMWSSPALSLDRIEVRTDRGLWLMVSPKDKAGFIAAVRARVPGIVLEGLETA